MRELIAAAFLVLALVADSSAAPLIPRDILASIVDGGIFALNPDSGESTLVAAGSYFDFSIASSGEIYALTGRSPFTDQDGTVTDEPADVVRIDPSTGGVETLSSGGLFSRPTGITVNQNGLFVLDRPDYPNDARIIQIDRGTGAQSVFAENLDPSGSHCCFTKLDLESDSNGDLFAVVFGLQVLISRIDGQTGESRLFTEFLEANHHGLGIGADDEMFLATTGCCRDDLFEIDHETGAAHEIHHNLSSGDVDVEASGTLIVASVFNIDSVNPCPPGANCLVRYDPTTRAVLRAFTGLGRASEVQVVPASVPEPGTAAEVLLGLLIVGYARSRRKPADLAPPL